MSTRSNLIFPYVIYHLLERIILAEKILTFTTGIGRQVPSPTYCKKGGELQLGRELNLGVPGVKRAEWVFRENQKIKQRIFQQYAKSKQRFPIVFKLCSSYPPLQAPSCSRWLAEFDHDARFHLVSVICNTGLPSNLVVFSG